MTQALATRKLVCAVLSATCCAGRQHVRRRRPTGGFGRRAHGCSRGGQGLAAVRDNNKPLMSELANRGLDSLLDRLFEVDKTPEDQQKGLRSLKALRELSDASKPMSATQRQLRVRQVTEGIRTSLPNLNDPNALLQYAATLLEYGVKRDVNTLEYWGENPATQGQLKPVAQTVVDLLDKCAAVASAQADAVANTLQGATTPTPSDGSSWTLLPTARITSGTCRSISPPSRPTPPPPRGRRSATGSPTRRSNIWRTWTILTAQCSRPSA